MAAAVAITRMDLTAARLRAGAAREKDSAAARRMLAIALILEGVDRATAARSCGMDRQTLRDWVHRWNAEGLEGLRDRKGLGAVPKLSAQQLAEFSAMVEDGPDQAVHKVVRWRQRDLCDELKRPASRSTNARWASIWPSWATGGCRSARNTPRATRKPKRLLKKLQRDCP